MKLEKRNYTKKELACLCYPELPVQSAAQKFRRDVYGCTPLQRRLQKKGYNKNAHYLQYWQVVLIMRYVYPDVLG